MTRITALAFSTLIAAASAFAADSPKIAFSPEGAGIECGWSLVLDCPKLVFESDGKKESASAFAKDGKLELSYPCGAKIVASNEESGKILYSFETMPETVKKLEFSMILAPTLVNGATWTFDNAEPGKFPPPSKEKPIFARGSAKSVLFSFPGQGSLRLSFERPCYQQLQDNRMWSWPVDAWMALADIYPSMSSVSIGVSASKPLDVKPLVDKFGQSVKAEFPGKINDEAELKADVKADEAYYASFKPPELDRFGGLPGSRERFGLKKTGFFHLEKVKLAEGKSVDSLVDPDGNIFFQLAVCPLQPGDACTYIKGREGVYEWLPSYSGEYQSAFFQGKDNFSFYISNVIRKYGEPFDYEKWSARMMGRLRAFGFNSIGAFGGQSAATAAMNVPFTPGLPLQHYKVKHLLEGFFDPFDSEIRAKVSSIVSETAAKDAENPLIIGYFLENEQQFSDIPKLVPAIRGNVPAKLALVKMLEAKYKTSSAFSAAWGVPIASFDELSGISLMASNPASAKDLNEYQELFIEEYFKVICESFRKADKNHMLVGTRLLPSAANNEAVNRISGKHMDILSVNYYTDAFDASFLERLNRQSGLPILLSEWSYGTDEQGLAGGVRNVKSQTERGNAYRNYVEQGAALPFVVGIQWFSAVDQALTGRWFQKYNGENMNIGIFNVADRPYKDFAAEASKGNYGVYGVKLGEKAPFACAEFLPKKGPSSKRKLVQIPRALPGMKLDGSRANWPGRPSDRIGSSDLVSGKDAGSLSADFWLCWDERNLYVYAEVKDPTPRTNANSGELVWNGDAIELFFGASDLQKKDGLLFSDRQLVFAIGHDVKAKLHWFNSNAQPSCESVVASMPDGSGYVFEAAIPLDAIGLKPSAGSQALFDFGLDDGGELDGRRGRQFMWSGNGDNSSTRAIWGLAKLVD